MASLFVSRFPVVPGRRADFMQRFRALYSAARPILEVETTVLFYGWSRTGQFVAIESYRDEERLNALRASDGFKAGFRGLVECCSGPMTIELFSGIDINAPSLGHDTVLFDELYPAGASRVHPEVNGIKSLIL